MIDDGQSNLLGYIVGTSDTKAFANAWQSKFLVTVSEALDALASRYESENKEESTRQFMQSQNWKRTINTYDRVIHGGLEPVIEEFPAHYHICV